jgi:hypothetical protein
VLSVHNWAIGLITSSQLGNVHNWLDHKFTQRGDHKFKERGDHKIPVGTGISGFRKVRSKYRTIFFKPIYENYLNLNKLWESWEFCSEFMFTGGILASRVDALVSASQLFPSGTLREI